MGRNAAGIRPDGTACVEKAGRAPVLAWNGPPAALARLRVATPDRSAMACATSRGPPASAMPDGPSANQPVSAQAPPSGNETTADNTPGALCAAATTPAGAGGGVVA